MNSAIVLRSWTWLCRKAGGAGAYRSGFDRNDLQRPVETFSGGWQMRIELAKILLRKPEIVLLDEPTNHLDIESIQWLEHICKPIPEPSSWYRMTGVFWIM